MVEFYLGKRSYHSYALENVTYGTANLATNWGYLGAVDKITPDNTYENQIISVMDDIDSRNIGDYAQLLKRYKRTIEFKPQHGRFLILAYGSDTFSTGTPAIHTITETNDIPSFSLCSGYRHSTDPLLVDTTGLKVDVMTIEVSKGDWVKVILECIGQKQTEHAIRSYNTADHLKKWPIKGVGSIKPYRWHNIKLEINGVDYSTQTNNIKLTVKNNLYAEPQLDGAVDGGQALISEPIPQIREYELTVNVNIKSTELYDIAESGTYITTPPVITLIRDSQDKIVFTGTNAIVDEFNPPLEIEEGVVAVDIPMKCTKIIPVETNSIDIDYDTAAV